MTNSGDYISDDLLRRIGDRIKAALRHGSTTLDLSGWREQHEAIGLTELPESLRELTQLDSLYLSVNSLARLPQWLGELKQLRSLDLTNNKLGSLPDSIGEISTLQTLLLTYNKLVTVPESIGNLTQLTRLELANNQLKMLPETLGRLAMLPRLDLHNNRLESLPESIAQLIKLRELKVSENRLTTLPESIGLLSELATLDLSQNKITVLPESLQGLVHLKELYLHENQLTDLPAAIGRLERLQSLTLDKNPLNPELAAAYKDGIGAVKRYLKYRSQSQVILNEAKLILIGEGEVGKTCLLGALRGDPWEEGRPTTHGIEIKPVKLVHPDHGTEITLNGWDFGGQRVYRPTHQLFFSAPAVYLVVWKPREGPQQGFVKEWIKLVKYREPEAKILVVATHGGPKQRQPDIDRQDIWDRFGRDMVVDFKLIESKPDESGNRSGIGPLKDAIASVAAGLPEVGRAVPERWEDLRTALLDTKAPYLPLSKVLVLSQEHNMTEEEARDFLRLSHSLGHLIHYEHDPLLRDIIILKPDWLASAISFVLDDRQTRDARGLVEFSRLSHLWNDPEQPRTARYDPSLHPLFLRLMERFDLSYKVVIPTEPEDAISFWQRLGTLLKTGKKRSREEHQSITYTSLIAQLVPDIRPDSISGWTSSGEEGVNEQVQVCCITETSTGQTAEAEGLFFQLIVRLHKYSLGRLNYADSIHWKRGLVLEDDFGARALLEHVGNDVRITVRSPYPERFLAALTYEVKWLVESFWSGLRCDVMVPCLFSRQCTGLFEVRKLIENKKRNRPEQPCPKCNEWQSVEVLLHNAPLAHPNPLEELLKNSTETKQVLRQVRLQLRRNQSELLGRFDRLDANTKQTLSKVEAAYSSLMLTLIDEAKDGPRLFSFEPVTPGFFDRPSWMSEKFRLTLWCEHSRLPLSAINSKGDDRGVYELTLEREWVVTAAPFLKLLAGTLSLVLPVASSAMKLVIDDSSYKLIEKELNLGEKTVDALLKGGEKTGRWVAQGDAPDLEQGSSIRARGAALRQLHSWLKEKDPSFGGLVRVQNKRHEFLWVHSKFATEY